jgi:poly-gamma-glutamate capsule biosynthesis protein CapA/YwtB (metallophosphatase superfamily)
VRFGRRSIAGPAALFLAAATVGCGGSGQPAAGTSAPVPWASPTAEAYRTPQPSPAVAPTPAPTDFPIAVVTRYDDLRPGIAPIELAAQGVQGRLIVPCEISGLTLEGDRLILADDTLCLPAEEIVAGLQARPGVVGLLPPGLVSPSVKVLPIGQADLFGAPSHRVLAYPLAARLPPDRPVPAWTAYDVAEVRTLISTGDTCPDRGVSHQTLALGKGWDWAFDGGSVSYTGFRHSYFNWSVPKWARNDDAGALAALISDHDVALNDFECPMVSDFRQHDEGTLFTIDPRFAGFLASRAGVDVVTIGSNHMNDLRGRGISQTIAALDEAGIAHTGAGMDLAEALAPAVVDVRGMKFAFVGWDEGGTAGPTTPGVAQLTSAHMCASLEAARKVADVVIAAPQWGWPEYHPDIASLQIGQRATMWRCGADDILGSGTHVASWASIDVGPNGPRVALGSHGNFLFDQNWARWTMEGVIVEATFYGTRLAQFRLHPYVMVEGGQPNLIDPLTDGAKVISQVWAPTKFVCCRP